MRLLPISPLLGQLRLKDMYDYCDKPCTFTCINTVNQLFLVIYLSSSEYTEEWLYLPLSNERYTSIKEGDIDLYNAFKGSETDTLYKVVIPKVYAPHQVSTLTSDDLIDEWLPNEGEYLIQEL